MKKINTIIQIGYISPATLDILHECVDIRPAFMFNNVIRDAETGVTLNKRKMIKQWAHLKKVYSWLPDSPIFERDWIDISEVFLNTEKAI